MGTKPRRASKLEVRPSLTDLRGLELFQDLEAVVLEAALPWFEVKRLKARSSANVARDLRGRIGFAVSGRYRILATAANGATVDLYTLNPGGMINHSLAVMDYDMGDGVRLVADEAGSLLLIAKERLFEIMDRSPALTRAFMRALAKLNLTYAARVFELAAFDTRARLYAELLRIAGTGKRDEGRLIVSPAPTQAAIAAQLGVSREAVTRNLGQLAQEGLIRLNRRTIEFVDLERLQALDRQSPERFLFKPNGK